MIFLTWNIRVAIAQFRPSPETLSAPVDGSMTPLKALVKFALPPLVATVKRPPWTAEAQNMATRFRKHGVACFRFITTPGVEPTNNLAERAIRFVVIDRKVTQGTRGQAGRRWSECIWTTLATCVQQGRSVFECIERAVHAHFTGQPAPCLLLNSP